MTFTATFAGDRPTDAKYTGYYNDGIRTKQQSIETHYDQYSDVLVAKETSTYGEDGTIPFQFKRLGAIAEVTLKGLSGTELLSVKIESLTEGVDLAGKFNGKEFVEKSKLITITCLNEIVSGNVTLRFVSLPVSGARLRFVVETLDDAGATHKYAKSFAEGASIDFSQGDLTPFSIGFGSQCEVSTTATFSVNGAEKSDVMATGEKINFPEVEESLSGFTFVGWTKTAIEGTQDTEPQLVDTANEVMDAGNVTYYAVYAIEGGCPETTASFDVKGMTTGGYKEGTKNDNKGNTWTYFASIANQSGTFYLALNSNSDNHNIGSPKFAGNVSAISLKAYNGSAKDDRSVYFCSSNAIAQPTSGDFASITIAKSEMFTTTYNVDLSSSPEFDQFYVYVKDPLGFSVINVTYGGLTYSDYCTSVDTREVVFLSWSMSSFTARIGEQNNFPTLTKTPTDLSGVTYSSSNTNCATIDSSTGNITIVAAGSTTITASFAGDDNYQPSATSYELTVNEAVAKHTLHFSVNGSLDAGVQVSENDPIIFPENPSIKGMMFLGWIKEVLTSPQQTAPICVTKESETMGISDVTYYAVFYKQSGSEPTDELIQTLQYDEWTYYGSTTDKTNYRLFHSGSYIESGSFDLSKLSKVVVYGGTFGGSSYNKITIGDGTNTWKSETVSGDSQTGKNTYTNGTALSGTGKLRITSNSGSASSNGVRISKVEIYISAGGYVNTDYCTTVEVVELQSISVSGTPEEFWKNDTFNHDGILVTAKWNNGDESDVTSEAIFSSPDMSTAGSKTITVTYDGKSTTYNINVRTIANTQATAYTASQAIALIDAGKDLKTEVYVKGKISKIVTDYNPEYGNISFNISANGREDGDQFQFYRNFKGAEKTKWTDEDTKPAVGNEVIGFGSLVKFGSTYEFAEGNYIVSIVQAPYLNAEADNTSIAATGGTVTITVDSNIEAWTVSSDNAAFTVGTKSGNTVPVMVTENTSTTDGRTAKITVSASGVPDVEITLTQLKKSSGTGPAVNTVLWGEDFTHFGSNTPSAAGTGTGTTIYGGATITYAQSSPNTKGYNEKLAGGTAPELLLSKSNQTWTISGILCEGVSEMSLTFLSNKTTFAVSSKTTGISVSGSQKSWTITNTGASTFSLEIKNSGSENARIDNVILKVIAN